jgi:hypothetical protein
MASRGKTRYDSRIARQAGIKRAESLLYTTFTPGPERHCRAHANKTKKREMFPLATPMPARNANAEGDLSADGYQLRQATLGGLPHR